jgi:hypothetical protein
MYLNEKHRHAISLLVEGIFKLNQELIQAQNEK